MGFDAVIDSVKLNGALTATAEAIRSKTDSTEPITFDMDDGFKSAVEGIATGGGGDTEAAYEQGVADGKKAEYDAFWDEIQQNGKRTNYALGLCGNHWTKHNFKPKYPINPVGSAENCFAYWQSTVFKDLIDLRECCELNTSQATSLGSAFYGSARIYAIGVLDCRNCSKLDAIFANCSNLTIIEKMISVSAIKYNNSFQNCTALKEIRFEGEIGQPISFQWSTKLSKASIESIISCLSTTTSGLTVTLSKTAKESAFTADEWTALANTRPNWTITLV